MKNKIKFALPLLIVFVSSATLKPCLADEPSKGNVTEDTVKFESAIGPDAPLTVSYLASTMKEHPSAKKFRTDWSVSVGSGTTEGAILYDRQLKALRYYERNSDAGGVSTSLYTLSGVTDEILQRFESDLSDKEKYREILSETKFVFDALVKYGCKKTGGWRFRKWSEKEPSLRGK